MKSHAPFQSPYSSRPEWPKWCAAWDEGIGFFNSGRYWNAHESWEQGWVSLPPDLKNWIQGLIQACGSFHLFQLGRLDPAHRLARLAQEKLKLVPVGPARVIEVPGLGDWLLAPSPQIPALQAFPQWAVSKGGPAQRVS